MVNLILFPFRLLGWFAVQLTRFIGLLIIQPLRLLLSPLRLLSSRITLLIVFIVYGAFALRLSAPHPVGQWYTTLIQYPDYATVSHVDLFVDTIMLRETYRTDLREVQFMMAFWLVVLFAVFKITRKNHQRLRQSLATTAGELMEKQPPRLWTARPAPVKAEVMPVVATPAPAPSKLPKTKPPKKPAALVHARYGLCAQSGNESLEVVADRLAPELRAFIGLD